MSLVIDRSEVPQFNRPDFPFQNRFISVDGGKMHYIDEGVGEPIVFVHGTPTWSYLWRNLVRELRTEYRCVAMDNIGFGLSAKPEAWSYSSFVHARNLKLLIDERELTGVTLVLHGFGGPIGLQYALENLSNVRRVVILNSWAWSLKDDPTASKIWNMAAGPLGMMLFLNMVGAKKLMRSVFGDKGKFTAALEEAYSTPFEAKEDRHGLHKQIRQVLEGGPTFDEVWSRRDELKGIPFQFIWGMSDPTFGERALNRFWREFPTADVARFPGCGHFVPEERPAECVRTLREFLASTRGNSYLA